MDGGSAVMSIIEGDDDRGGRENESEEVEEIVGCDWDELLDAKKGWDAELVEKSSNGHQSSVVEGAPGVPD